MSCTDMLGTSSSTSSPMGQPNPLTGVVNSNSASTATLAASTNAGVGKDGSDGSSITMQGQNCRCTTPIFGLSSPMALASSLSPPRSEKRSCRGGLSSPVAPHSSWNGAMTPAAGSPAIPAMGALTPVSSNSNSSWGATIMSTGSAPRRRMRGLVRRTHSPRNMPSPLASPVQPHHIVLSPTSSNRNLVMRPSPRQSSSARASPVSCLAQAMNRTNTTLKRKRRQDDNSKTFAPIMKKKRKSSPQRCSPPPSFPECRSNVNVMTVNPTVRGIMESARVLLSTTPFASSSSDPTQDDSNSGILSFPTETVYTLCCGITMPSKNCNYSGETTTVLDQLLRLKGLQNPSTNKFDVTSDDIPLLYLHHSAQAERYAHFTKPKTFVLKPSSQSSSSASMPQTASASSRTASGASSDAETPNKTKLTAVTFSESREVYRRLTDAFWPGPLVIYVRSVGKTSSAAQNMQRPNSQDEPEAAAPAPSCADVPVLPEKLLLHNGTPSNENQKEEDQKPEYIGLRCPSHPLARKILAETYYGISSSSSSSCAKRKRTKQRSRNVAIIGFSASPSLPLSKEVSCTNPPAPPTRAGEVCARLLALNSSSAPSHPSLPPLSPANLSGNPSSVPQPTTVHVLNGEAKREMFSVPTCQFGSVCPVSILIDDERRTVHVFKVKPQSSSSTSSSSSTEPLTEGNQQNTKNIAAAEATQSHPHADITVELVKKALLRPSPISVVAGERRESSDGRSSSIGSGGSLGASSCSSAGTTTVGTGARLVTAILRKWKVVGDGEEAE